MGLLAWFLGPKPDPKPEAAQSAAVKVTMLTILERRHRRLQRARRQKMLDTVWGQYCEARMRFLAAEDPEERDAAARNIAVAAAELRLLQYCLDHE